MSQLAKAAGTFTVAGSKEFFFIHFKNKFIRIEVCSIRFVLSLAHHVKLCTDEGIFIPYLSLKQFEEYLPIDQFCRVNRGTLVALNRITAYTKDEVCIKEVSFTLTDKYRKELESKITILMYRKE